MTKTAFGRSFLLGNSSHGSDEDHLWSVGKHPKLTGKENAMSDTIKCTISELLAHIENRSKGAYSARYEGGYHTEDWAVEAEKWTVQAERAVSLAGRYGYDVSPHYDSDHGRPDGGYLIDFVWVNVT